jgi:hypothetical protein
LRKLIFENFSISKNNTICAEAAKVLPEYQLLSIPVGSWNGFIFKKYSDQPSPRFGFLKLSYQSGPSIGSEAGRSGELILVSSSHIPVITSALLRDWYWYKAGIASSYT